MYPAEYNNEEKNMYSNNPFPLFPLTNYTWE